MPRAVDRGVWLPVLLLGVLSLGAVGFYRLPPRPGPGGLLVVAPQVGPSDVFGRYAPFINGSPNTSRYWLFGLAAIYLIVLVAQFRRWNRHETTIGRWIWPTSGLAALVVLFLTSPWAVTHWAIPRLLTAWRDGAVGLRGFLPLLVIALSLLTMAMAIAERSIIVGLVALAYAGLAIVANLYNVENLVARLGWNLPYEDAHLPNLILPTALLLVAVVVFVPLDHQARLRRRPPT